MVLRQKSQYLLWALCILLLAALLRIAGLSFGQPNLAYHPTLDPLIHQQTPLHPDEYFYVAIPFEMRQKKNLNPHFFENPSFFLYLNYFAQVLTGSGIENETLALQGRDDINIRNYAPFPMYVLGRYFSVLGGMLAVAGTMGLARSLGGRKAALFAGGLAACSLPLVQHSHYATTSSLASGFVMLTLWASVQAIVYRDVRWLWLAGLCAGLAAGNRYNAAAVSLSVLMAGLLLLHLQRSWRFLPTVLLGWLLFPVTFLATSPYVALDFSAFWGQFSAIYLRYKSAGDLSSTYGMLLEYRYMIVHGLGGLAFVGVLWGVGVLWQRKRLYLMLLLVYLIPYSLVVLRNQRVETGDQLTVVVIPILIVFAGYALHTLSTRRGLLAYGLFIATLIAPAILSLQFIFLLTRQDTRLQAQEWVYTHIPEGSTVLLAGGYNVPLDSGKYQTEQLFGVYDPKQTISSDYVIVSDAVFLRGNNPQEFARQLAVYEQENTGWILLQEIPRPVQAFAMWRVNNAAYWHHPGIRIFCTHAQACEVPFDNVSDD